MKHIRSLYRSPLKTTLTLLLLAAAAFLFLYNLSEYSISDREYREARDRYEGVLTVEVGSVPDNNTIYDLFLLTDETGRTESYGNVEFGDVELTYESNHQRSLGEDLMEKLASLPHVSRVEKRYLTAGVSPEYYRLDTDNHYYPFAGRAVIAATVKNRYQSSLMLDDGRWVHEYNEEIENIEYLTLEDVELLAGDPAWLYDIASKKNYAEHILRLSTYAAHCREDVQSDYTTVRWNMLNLDNFVYSGEADFVQPGGRYVFVVRNCIEQPVAPLQEYIDKYPSGYRHTFDVGDDSLKGWWPYFTDVTDAPENWLEGEEYADLRELIRVTNDDVHTFDVVYGDDMAAQRRAAEGRMVCEEGRFIGPADAGQPVCVVNVDFLEANGLSVGDTVTLDLGNYLSEQYAPLGAVAVTRGRQNTEYKTQEFTIIGSWRDLNEGNHVYRDRFWCWSNNAIFVPSAFLPECVNAQGHEFKPGEVSFVVGNAEEISAFVEECLPLVEELGVNYQFSDGGWLQIGENLMQSRKIALVKLLIFSGAALFALVLTVWLFIGRKKQEYGILRALGMNKKEAGARLYVPFVLLGILSTLLGFAAARIVTARQLAAEAAHVPAPLSVFLLGALGFLALLAVLAFLGLLLVRRRSILELVQGKQK
ncbi:MAG: ABC transporter permease [Oscillospiraceae bacterium]|nr:ABC transporter permease [Oscillospiraceae bacterium]